MKHLQSWTCFPWIYNLPCKIIPKYCAFTNGGRDKAPLITCLGGWMWERKYKPGLNRYWSLRGWSTRIFVKWFGLLLDLPECLWINEDDSSTGGQFPLVLSGSLELVVLQPPQLPEGRHKPRVRPGCPQRTHAGAVLLLWWYRLCLLFVKFIIMQEFMWQLCSCY